MTFKLWIITASILTLARSLHALPACPSTWNWSFSAPAEQWPDVDRTSDPRLLHGMARELYEHCPRQKDNNALLASAANKFLELTTTDPDQAPARQEAYFWLGMTYASEANDYDRQSDPAVSALKNFISLTDPELRRRAASQAQALRLRSARQLASLAYYTQLNARNLGKPGWKGASQRVKCFIAAYPDSTGDKEVRSLLQPLLKQARGFIEKHSSDRRYDLDGMNLLSAELEKSLTTPGAPLDRWPTKEDLDPTDADNPRNCYVRPSPIPGPEKFDFDFSTEGEEHRKGDVRNARNRAQGVLDGALP